ncbi:hypothetical protein BJV78DRAFT_292392 [Lactifluus subvellereus]|nr:hypothetical protein BJV78DRAFT_292392 [Lactifluus subvellereus]
MPVSFSCPWPNCEKMVNRKQDRDRHATSIHLPLFLLCRRCGRRDGREDEHRKHSKACAPGQQNEPCSLYNKKLVLGWVFEDGTPVETVERYALDFVREWAEKEGNQAVLNDPCGRQGTRNTGQCPCNEHHEVSTIAAPENATAPIDNDIWLPSSTNIPQDPYQGSTSTLSPPSANSYAAQLSTLFDFDDVTPNAYIQYS